MLTLEKYLGNWVDGSALANDAKEEGILDPPTDQNQLRRDGESIIIDSLYDGISRIFYVGAGNPMRRMSTVPSYFVRKISHGFRKTTPSQVHPQVQVRYFCQHDASKGMCGDNYLGIGTSPDNESPAKPSNVSSLAGER